MTYLTRFLVMVVALCPLSPAWAVPATDEGAARLTGVMQTYLGTVPGVVSVTPQGAEYALVIDPKPLLDMVAQDGVQITFEPVSYTLTDNGDGTWRVSEDQQIAWAINLPDLLEHRGSMHLQSDGVWSEALKTFTKHKSVTTDYVVATTNYASTTAPDGTTTTQRVSSDSQRIARAETETTGKAGAAGAVDQDFIFTATGMEQTNEIMIAPGQAPFQVALTVPLYEGSGQAVGLQSDRILSLLAWFVAHPSAEAIKGAQDGLRGELAAALPLWDQMNVDATLHDIKAMTPIGEVGLASVTADIGLSGISADGRFHESIAMTGLTLPEGVLPAWAVPLVPEEATFDLTASGFNLAAPAKMLIETFDLNATDQQGGVDPQKLQQAFLPDGSFSLKFAPSKVRGADYQLDYQADLAIGKMPMPTGSALISAQGLDNVEAALRAAPPEQGAQALMMLQMARSLAAPGADGKSVWAIEMTQAGSVTINGQPVGGPPAQP